METIIDMGKTSKWEFIIEKGPFKGSTDSIVIDGKILYYGDLTFNEYCQLPENRGKEFILISEKELAELNAGYRLSLISTEWKEITEDQYDEALCVLPPFNWKGSYFQCAEAYTMDLRSTYVRYKNKYYTAMLPSGSPSTNTNYLDLLPG